MGPINHPNAVWNGEVPNTNYYIQTPASHAHDPVTSFEAEEAMNKGLRGEHQKHAHYLVALHPGWTASQHSAWVVKNEPSWFGSNFDSALIEVRRRLSDLTGTHLRQGEPVKTLRPRREVTWWLK